METNFNIADDLETLLQIDRKYVIANSNAIMADISQCITDMIYDHMPSITIDIGYGILTVNYDGSDLEFLFTPAAKLVTMINNSIDGEVPALDKICKAAFTESCKEFYRPYLE